MSNYTYEAYEDNVDRLYLFALDKEQNIVWGACYDECYDRDFIHSASRDWLALMVEEHDPVEEDWDFGFFDGLEEAAGAFEGLWEANEERLGGAVQFASSDWSTFLPLGIDTEPETSLGYPGKDFAVKCGVATWCPECRYICNNVPDRHGEFYKPEFCDVCGASLEE